MLVGWEGQWGGGWALTLADRDQRETKLLLSKEMKEGFEIKLKTVPQTLLSFLRKLRHWQRLQKHSEPI